MIFHVPQFIDIEDKIVGPFTWKMLGWMAIMVTIMMILWNILEFAYFIIASVPVVVIFVALAFYKPYGLSLLRMIYFSLLYLFNAKLYTWHREPRMKRKKAPKKKQVAPNNAVEVITLDELQDMASLLDHPDASENEK